MITLVGISRTLDKIGKIVGRNVFTGLILGEVFRIFVNKFVTAGDDLNGFAAVIGNAEILDGGQVAFL